MMSLLFCLFSGLAAAAPAPVTQEQPPQQQEPVVKSDKKSTDMSFDELLVQGKYHFTDEAVTTVENDKILDGLLEVRKNFKDRIEQSAARY
jgi:RNase H-fold protein (predicted Holliday junction resolvase)